MGFWKVSTFPARAPISPRFRSHFLSFLLRQALVSTARWPLLEKQSLRWKMNMKRMKLGWRPGSRWSFRPGKNQHHLHMGLEGQSRTPVHKLQRPCGLWWETKRPRWKNAWLCSSYLCSSSGKGEQQVFKIGSNMKQPTHTTLPTFGTLA